MNLIILATIYGTLILHVTHYARYVTSIILLSFKDEGNEV